MAKRQKKVFASHAEVAHIWAHQNHEEGRAGNIFFRGSKLYSYGFHYLMAQIHNLNGKRFALVNSHVYSNSTAKHLGHTRSALEGLMQYFAVSDPSDIKQAVRDLDTDVDREMDKALKRKFFADSRWSDGSEKLAYLNRIMAAANEASRFRQILGRAEYKFPKKKYNEVVAHLEKLEARYNSPERAERRKAKEAERLRAREIERQKNAAITAQELAKFRAGKEFNSWNIDIEYDLLRIRGSRVETSRGAIVPLEAARELLRKINSRERVEGLMIGEYEIDGFNTDNESGDTFIKIGCHKILLSEAREVLEAPRSTARVSIIQGGRSVSL
jgi:hypothetical protein